MASTISHTVHLYDASEIASAQQRAIARGKINDACFCVIEQDLSGLGNQAWAVNFATISQDVGLANPTAVLSNLILYNRWLEGIEEVPGRALTQSHTLEKARSLLISSTVGLVRSLKSRISLYGCVVSLKIPLEELQGLEEDCKKVEPSIPPSILSSVEWLKELGPSVKVGPTQQLDAERVMHLFLMFLELTCELWNKIAEDKKGGKTDNPGDLPPEDAIYRLETTLLSLGLMILSIDQVEERHLPGKTPQFVFEAFERLPNTWQLQFHHIARSNQWYTRPLLWAYAPLLEKANLETNKKNPTLILSIIAYMELTARHIGDERLHFLNSILYVVRNKSLPWNMSKIEPTNIVNEKDVARLITLYDQYPPTAPRDPLRLSQRRSLTITPDYLDRNTLRSMGVNTLPFLHKYADSISLDISSWKAEELAKSHGPALLLHAKKSIGLPTLLSHFLDEGTPFAAELDKLEDPYRKSAKEILLSEEEKHGAEKTTPLSIQLREYARWLSAYGTSIPAKLDSPAAPPSPAPQPAKKKAPAKKKPSSTEGAPSKKKKKPPPPVEEEEESAEEEEPVKKPATKASKSKKRPPPPEKKEVATKKKEGSSKSVGLDEEFVIHHKLGDKIRVGKIVFSPFAENIDEEEHARKVKKLKAAKISPPAEEDDAEDGDSAEEKPAVSKKKKKPSASKEVPPSPSKKRKKVEAESSEEEEKADVAEEAPAVAAKPSKPKKKKPPSLSNFDLVEAVHPRPITDAERKAIMDAPLAQLPTGNSKKWVRVTPRKVYKGPYSVVLEKDVSTLQRVLYRSWRMKKQWKDAILLDQELVYDTEGQLLYLCSNNLGETDSTQWKTEDKEIKTHGGGEVTILTRESSRVLQLSKAIQSPAFASMLAPSLVDLACRYLVGSGDAHYGNQLISVDGTLHAVDIEENRETIPLMTDATPPTLVDCLFVHNKAPAKKDLEKFNQLLPSALPLLLSLVNSVKAENKSAAAQYATAIGFTNPPSDDQIAKRLATLEACIAKVTVLPAPSPSSPPLRKATPNGGTVAPS